MSEIEFQIIKSVGFVIALATVVGLQHRLPHAGLQGSWRLNGGLFSGDGALSLTNNETTDFISISLSSLAPIAGGLLLVSGNNTTFLSIHIVNSPLKSGESLLRIDPYVNDLARIIISNVPDNGDGSLFDTTGGSTGTFTSVADAAVGATAVTSVSDSSGTARFNFSVGPTLFVNQEIVISSFVTNTEYNGTSVISATGAGFFEILSIDFGTDETGSFLSNSVALTDVTTSLNDGDTLIIDTDDATDYDGGAVVYNKLVNSFQISRAFTSTESGTWGTAGIDQTDPRILTDDNPGFVKSNYIAAASVNNNSTANGAIVNNTFTDMVFGTGGSALIEGSTIERWKLIDEVNGTFECIGNEPFSGAISFDFTVTSTGGTVDFRFRWQIDTGGGFSNLPDNVESLVAVGSNAQSITKTFPLAAVKGDQIKPEITRNSGSSGITTQYATIYASQ